MIKFATLGFVQLRFGVVRRALVGCGLVASGGLRSDSVCSARVVRGAARQAKVRCAQVWFGPKGRQGAVWRAAVSTGEVR